MMKLKTFKNSYDEGVKLITYSTNGMMFTDNFKNINQLNNYVKSCGGYKALGDYEIYTLDNNYRLNSKKQWELLNIDYI